LTALVIFIIRAILGAMFAVLLTRFFYPRASIAWVLALVVLLVGLAYVTESFRKRRKGQ
jgi:predicted Na+-dependent transporter